MNHNDHNKELSTRENCDLKNSLCNFDPPNFSVQYLSRIYLRLSTMSFIIVSFLTARDKWKKGCIFVKFEVLTFLWISGTEWIKQSSLASISLNYGKRICYRKVFKNHQSFLHGTATSWKLQFIVPLVLILTFYFTAGMP